MKKYITLLILAAIFARPLHAQETPSEPAQVADEQPVDEPTGQIAMVATKAGQENNWQNWIFVGGALVAAAVAVLVVSLDSGSSAH